MTAEPARDSRTPMPLIVTGRLPWSSVTELREFVQEKLEGRQLVFALADDLLIASWAVSRTAAQSVAPSGTEPGS